MEKKKFVIDDHFYGRIFLALAIILIVLIPVIMCIILQVLPNFLVILQCIFPLITFIIGGFVEVITYSPMLGVSGTYLGFFTGNLVNLKVPCAVNAREQAGVKHGSKEGEIISTISVAVSTLVTTVILALGVALLTPLETVLHNYECLKNQLVNLFGCEVVNNYDWSKDINFIDFLRDFGKFFNVNYILSKDIVARRLEQGIT